SRDLDDRLVSSVNVVKGKPVTTQYFYQDFDELAWTLDADQHWTWINYDPIGRRTGISLPDSGVTTYHYDGLELVEIDDALGSSVRQFDALGRVKTVTDPDGVTSYTWDTAANGLGKIASTTSPDGTTVALAYDGLGRPVNASWTVAGQSFAIDHTYDGF